MLLTHERILATARAGPEREAFRFLPGGEDVGARLTYGTLSDQARAVAQALLARGLAGRPAALILDPGPEVPVALLGMMIAGVIVAPLPMPRGTPAVRRVGSALRALRPAVILCAGDIAASPDLATAGLPCLTVASLIEEGMRAASQDTGDRGAPANPAIIQFSSGSTAEPRGIVLSHGNIAANLAMIRDISGGLPGDVTVTWLPHSHDMGLFGTILTPLFSGGTVVLMPPAAFLRRPVRWLRAISNHGARHIAAPDFGYALCARRITPEAVSGLDLTSLACAFIGAEPTRMATLDAFSDALAHTGFRREALLSCYGLAEATLLCTVGRPEAVGRHVSCGAPAAGVRLALRPTSASPDPGTGEILIGGPHVALGHWCSDTGEPVPFPDECTDADGHRMIPTGDLGRLAEGALLVLDRLKDTLPVRGGTLGPSEVEAVACAVDSRIHAAAAVPSASREEGQICLAVEIDTRRLSEVELTVIEQRIAAHVAAEFGVQIRLHRLAPRALPRTTSGKIRRFAVRALVADGTAPDRAPPETMEDRATVDVAAFRTAGVVSPVPVMPPSEAEDILELLRRLSRLRGELPPLLRAKPHLLVPELWDLVHAPQVVGPVTQLLGPDVLCFGTSLIWKPPAKPLHVSWHQDATHWGLEDTTAVTAWLALTPSTLGNGCVCVVPGTHRAVVPHDHPDDALNMLGRKEVARVEIPPESVVPLELAAGEMSIHHALVLHGSAQNLSGADRIGFAMRFIAAGNGQRGGRAGTATLVNGKDHGRYELEVPPESLMNPAAMRRHAHILRRGHEIIYGS